MVTRSLVIAVLAVVVGYGLLEAWPLIAGPSLTIASPADGEAVADGIVEVRGTAHRAASLTLNGAILLPDQEGGFSSTLALPQGSSILEFVATDRFGRTLRKSRTIYVP